MTKQIKISTAISALEAVASGRPLSDLELAACASIAGKLRRFDKTGLTISSLRLSPLSPGKKKSAALRTDVVDQHLKSLRDAGDSREAFISALDKVLSDKSVRADELRALAAQFTGWKVTSKTSRKDAERMIRQAFSRRAVNEDAYRRIENLSRTG